MGEAAGRLPGAAAALLASPMVLTGFFVSAVAAQPAALAPRLGIDARLRYETAADDGFAMAADALTLRVRPSLEAPIDDRVWAVLEGEFIAAIEGQYEDRVGSTEPLPVIPDAEVIELNRASLNAEPLDGVTISVGRQRLSLDDERFIGAVDFRQNDQTFDAVSVSAVLAGGVTADAAYVWRVNRVFGRRSDIGRFEGDSFILNAGAPTAVGRLIIFHYALDLNVETGSSNPNAASSATTGVRLEGRRNRDNVGLEWEAAFARQRDYADNPATYEADYWLAGLAASVRNLTIGGRIETLGSNGAQAFQAPLGTLRAFQGHADVFLVTPAEGVRDVSVSGEARLGDIGPLRAISLNARRHWFEADAASTRFGEEWNVGFKAKIKSIAAISIERAAYRADEFGEDVDRWWFSLRRRF